MPADAVNGGAEDLWKIGGLVVTARVSGRYRLAMFFVAAAMILLPLLYLGLIATVAWWLWDYLQEASPTSGRRGSSGGSILLFLIPIVVGGIVLLFLIKPLFHRRRKSPELRSLRREDEPRLFRFIDTICDLIRAPRPRSVKVELQVNAAAGLAHGMWSTVSRSLDLTIGLPLAGGLSVRQFGGVLAHEFGHFAQGAGMGATYVVRMVSMWFARVVYERDQWDATLEAWARHGDWRVMLVLQFARLLIWVVRKILWVLMMLGHLLSCVLLRQMEFDADACEIQAGGSDTFTATARTLRLLNVGAHITHGKQEESFHAKRLVDDLTGWILHETSRLTPETREKVLTAATAERTGWLDTHPSDAERIARAEAARAAGVLTGDGPASALFADFAGLSREVTLDFYRQVLELPEKGIELQPLSTMTAESEAAQQGGEAMEKLFHGLLTARTLVFLSPSDLEPGAGPGIPAARPLEPGEAERAAVRDLDEAISRQNEMHGVVALFEAGIAVNAASHKLSGGGATSARSEVRRAAERLEAASAVAQPLLAHARGRMIGALQWHLAQPATPAALAAEIRLLVRTLSRLETLAPALNSMRPLAMGMMAIFNNHEQASDKQSAFGAAKARAGQLQRLNEQILAAVRDADYPFEHAGGQVKLSIYLLDGVDHPDDMVLTLLRADAILERLYAIYARAMGRLAVLTLEAEAAAAPPGKE